MTHRLMRDGALYLYGFVGYFDPWLETGFSSTEVIAALSEAEGDLTVHINSAGGLVTEGVAIHNALAQHDGAVTVMVDGIAASAASLIAMAGADIVMAAGAIMMIHDPSGLTYGTADDHLKQATALEKMATAVARVYARRSDQTLESVRTIMREETWFDGPDAVEAGFADRSADDPAADPDMSVDYRAYMHAPAHLLERAEQFARQGQRMAAPRAVYGRAKETRMTTKPQAPANVKPAEPQPPALTMESLQADHAELAAGLIDQGAEAERNRILGIEANALPGHEALVAELKADGKTTPDQAASRILKAEKDSGAADCRARLAAVEEAAAAAEAGMPEQSSSVHLSDDELAARWRSNKSLHADYPTVDVYVHEMKREQAK